MTVFWLVLGVLMASSVWLIYIKFQVLGKMSKIKWILSGLSILWGAFTIAWIISSLSEGEPRAAGMGSLIFGVILLGLILLTVKFNFFMSKIKKTQKKSQVT